jgi:hypothetical protein
MANSRAETWFTLLKLGDGQDQPGAQHLRA